VDGREGAGADPGGVDWVASHPPFGEAHHKNLICEKKEIHAWVPKNIEIVWWPTVSATPH